jgi:hypothetical protein
MCVFILERFDAAGRESFQEDLVYIYLPSIAHGDRGTKQ